VEAGCCGGVKVGRGGHRRILFCELSCFGSEVDGTPEGCSGWSYTGGYGERDWWRGLSQRAVAREFGISREMVGKMLQYAVPPGYRRQQPVKRPMLGALVGVIDAIVEDDKQKPARQRHTAKRIFDRLQAEHGFIGGYTTIKNYVRGAHVRGREMFVPLAHPPGEAQVDFPPQQQGPCSVS
jgi:hypothetical protein